MSGVWGLAQLVLIAALLCAGVTVASTLVVYPRLRRRLLRVQPARRALLILIVALAPVLVPAAMVLASLAPPVAASLLSVSDHCLAHHDDHSHICPVHLPTQAGSMAGWLGMAAVLVLILMRLLPLMLRGWRSLQTVLRLRRSLAGQCDEVVWIDEARPVAFTVGWWRPTTLISTATRSCLSSVGLHVLLGHEQEHRRRRDPLLRSIVSAATTLLPGPVGDMLVSDWQLAAEQACDGAAATECGNPVEVAQTILAIERALAITPTPGVAFGDSIVEERVQHLLTEQPAASTARWLGAATALAIAVLLAASPVIHHVLETVLEALLQ